MINLKGKLYMIFLVLESWHILSIFTEFSRFFSFYYSDWVFAFAILNVVKKVLYWYPLRRKRSITGKYCTPLEMYVFSSIFSRPPGIPKTSALYSPGIFHWYPQWGDWSRGGELRIFSGNPKFLCQNNIKINDLLANERM